MTIPRFHSLHQVSALHYAARQNSLAIMELLLDHGAEVDRLAAGDLTPLHFAARFILTSSQLFNFNMFS